jgi:hypothetical protein
MQFIPFEDDWDALAQLRPEDLVPYRIGMLEAADHQVCRAAPRMKAFPSGFASGAAQVENV